MTEDQELWESLCRGEREAFELLYREYGARVRGFLRQYVGNARAEDICQETFLQIWRRPNGFDPARGPLKSYVFGIARKRAAQWHRDETHRAKGHGREACGHQAGSTGSICVPKEQKCSGTDAFAQLREVLKQLNPESRALLWLREVEGYTYAELAQILDVPLGTVKSRLSTAREEIARLRQASRAKRLEGC